MAIFTAFLPVSMPNIEIWFGSLLSNTSSTIVINDGNRQTTYSGSFTYPISGGVEGTVTGITEQVGSATHYTVTGLSTPADQLYNAVQILADFDTAAELVGGGNDTFFGSSGNDEARSYSGNDIVEGRGGNDRLDGGAGNDTLFGGDAFTFIGNAGFSGDGASSAGELRLQSLGGPNAVLVEADHNGDGTADLQIFVNLTTTLTATDFIL